MFNFKKKCHVTENIIHFVLSPCQFYPLKKKTKLERTQTQYKRKLHLVRSMFKHIFSLTMAFLDLCFLA